MTWKSLAVIFTVLICGYRSASAATSITAGPPDSSASTPTGLHPIDYVLNRPGSTLSFAIISSTYSGPISSLMSVTGTHTVTTPDPFELSLTSPLSLLAGDYQLFAFIEIPPGNSDTPTTQIVGFISMPFTLTSESTVTSIGVSTGEDFAIYLLANPIPEPSSLAFLGATLVLCGRRRR